VIRPRIVIAALAATLFAATVILTVGGGAVRLTVDPSRSPEPTSDAMVDPAANLKVLNEHGVTLRYPASWFAHEVTELDLGRGSTYVVLTSEPFPAICGDPASDLNCIEGQPLGPGAIRVEVGEKTIRGGSFFDRIPAFVLQGAQITRGSSGGMPAIRFDRPVQAGQAFDIAWQVAVPDSVERVLVVDASGDEPGADLLRSAAQNVIESITFDRRPAPVPADPAAAAAAERAVKVAAVADVVADGGGEVVVSGPTFHGLGNCFRAAIDQPAILPVDVRTVQLPAGSVRIKCTISIVLVKDAFWRVTIVARSGLGSTVPGTTATVTVWRTTGGESSSSLWEGSVPGAATAGALPLDAAGAATAADLATQFDVDDTDFYRCFPAEPDRTEVGGSVAAGPDHRLLSHALGVTCRTEVTIERKTKSFRVTLTASWQDNGDHGAGQTIVHLVVGTDGSIGEPTIEGDPLP
jgi:hypothetical protein